MYCNLVSLQKQSVVSSSYENVVNYICLCDCILSTNELHSGRINGSFKISENQRSCKRKGKAIPLQSWRGPEGSRKLKLPDFKTIGT
jgi:hypothetical protein